MKLLLKVLIGTLALVAPALALAQTQGISQLSPFIISGGQVRLSSTTAAFRVPSLINCDTIDTNSSGVFTCGTDATGGGGGSVGNWFTPVSYGNATSTTLGFLQGFTALASSTVAGSFHLGLSNGALGINGGLVYSGATTTAGTGLTYTGNAFNVTGLTTTQFASPNISQWTNDAGYITSAASFSTTSANFWAGLGLAFSTTSANYASNVFLAATSSIKSITTLPSLSLPYSQLTGTPTVPTLLSQLTNDVGFVTSSFSTTSANFWSGLGLGFSTTSANYASYVFLAATSSVKSITTLPSLSLPYVQLTSAPTSLPTSTLLANSNTFTGLNKFSNSSTTLGSFTYASSTTYFGAGLTNCNSASNALTWSGGTFGCNTISGGAGSVGNWFTPDSNFGALANSTTTPIWLKAGVQASSTSQFESAITNALTVRTTFGNITTGTFDDFLPAIYGDPNASGLAIAPSQSGTGDLYLIASTTYDDYIDISDGFISVISQGLSFQSTGDMFLNSQTGNFIFNNQGSQQGRIDFSGLTLGRVFTLPDETGTVALGTGSAGNCAQWSTTNTLTTTGSPCSGGGSPGGSNGQLQFNDGGSTFGGWVNSFINKTLGVLGIGTSTPKWLLQLASSTAPQLALTSSSAQGNFHWTFNNIFGNLFLATSSDSTFATSTSSTPYRGYVEFPNNGGCIGCTDIILPNGVNLRNGKYFEATSSAMVANTFTDLYTAPAGRRALINSMSQSNSTSGTINTSLYLKTGGAYYKVAATSTVLTGATRINGQAYNGLILDPGESVAILTDTTGSGNPTWIYGVEYDATVPLHDARLLNPGSGTTTLYTAPAGASALITQSNLMNTGGGQVLIYNAGAANAHTLFKVKPGQNADNNLNQTTATSVLLGANAIVADSLNASVAVPIALNSGDSIQIWIRDSMIGTQSMAWLPVYEH